MLYLASLCIAVGIGYNRGVYDRKPMFFKYTEEQGIQLGCMRGLNTVINNKTVKILNGDQWIAAVYMCTKLTRKDL